MSVVLSRRDVDFLLFDWLKAAELTERERYAEHSRETFDAVLDLSETIATERFAPINRLLDANEPVVGEDGKVVLPAELSEALAVYRDSGMPDSEANARPEAFANADLDEAVGRLVEVIRRERPQVILTYGDDQQFYPHPDHLMVHDISVPAFQRAGDADWRPELGAPWTPAKLYYSAFSFARVQAMHDKMVELGVESPYDERWLSRPSQDHRVTTVVDIGPFFDVRLDALLAHATQVDPTSPFWFGLPREVARTIEPTEEYILAESRVPTELPEDDLFAGLR